MTEYIIEWEGIGAEIVNVAKTSHYCLISKRLRENRRKDKIIRCRDCKHYYEHEVEDKVYCTPRKIHGVYSETEPDGFCAWGEKVVKE